jgi:ABC-type nitrate/sulfonate/bicarbonate transport system ATPase subunit
MAHWSSLPGVDPLNLWGNAREGSDVQTGLEPGPRPASSKPIPPGDGAVASPTGGAVAAPVQIANVTRAYAADDRGTVQALAGISLHAMPNELLAVVGPSGCGKTTLLELICGLQQPEIGTIECAPAVLMPQRDLLLPWLSALDNAALALRIAHVPRAQARARAAEVFAELGLTGFESARPYELSGGMRQRVAFVRTLLSGKRLLCLDEPFGALDAITRAEMHAWLAEALEREPRTVVLVTHDVEEAVVLADRVVVLSPRPGRVVAELEVGLARPRSRTDADVVALRERALIALQTGTAAGAIEYVR